jgi:lipoyl(octanoyl) transferase
MPIEVKNSNKRIDYIKSMKMLEKRVDEVLLGKKDELLWILEHKPVYTGGINYQKKDILDKKLKIIQSNRGGKITFHGPGQKVVYFVLNLNKRGKDIRKLIDKIEICIQKILKEYNISSYPDRKNIGIWVGNKKKSKKIAAIGIKVRKWIAYHGFALNVNNDLSQFNKIIPCGIKNKGITSIKNLGRKKYNNINSIIIKKFLDTFL